MANQTYKIKLTALDKTKAAFNAVKTNLTKVKNTASGVTTAVGRTTSALSKAAVSFGLVAAAVGATIKATLDYADAVGKSATRTGLSTDLIQALQIAFIEAGASAETAEKALTKFTRSVGDAQKGLKTYSDIFRDLGVEIEDSEGKFRGEEVVLLDTVDAISRLSSTTERATVMANLFGRSGIIIADAFKGGSDGVKEFLRRLDDLGIGLNEQGIRNAETLNDSMFVLTKQFNTIKDEILLGFIPVFQDVVNFFQKYFHELTVANGGTEVFAQTLAKNAITALANFLDAIGNVMVETKKFGIRINITKLELKGLIDGLIQSYDEFVKLPFVIGLTSDQIAGLMGIVTDNLGNFIDYTDEIRGLETQLENVKNPMDAVVARLLKLREEVGSNTEAYATLTEFIEAFRKAGEANQTSLTDQQSAFERYKQELEDSTLAIENATIKAFRGMEDALVNFVRTGKLDFKSMVDSMIADLIRLSIQQAITQPLFERFSSSSFFGNIKSFFGTDVPSGDGGGFTGYAARTGGIDGKGGFPAILHPNETIIDHTKGQQMGMSAPSVNFTIQATDASGFDELLSSRKNQIVAMISQAMNQKGKVGLI
jgi:hypothetical protein